MIDDDTGDEASVAEAQRQAALRFDRDKTELQALLKRKDARFLIWRVLEQCGVYHTNVHIDARAQIQEGRRSIGLWLLEQVLQAEPNSYTLIRAEAVLRDTVDRNDGEVRKK